MHTPDITGSAPDVVDWQIKFLSHLKRGAAFKEEFVRVEEGEIVMEYDMRTETLVVLRGTKTLKIKVPRETVYKALFGKLNIIEYTTKVNSAYLIPVKCNVPRFIVYENGYVYLSGVYIHDGVVYIPGKNISLCPTDIEEEMILSQKDIKRSWELFTEVVGSKARMLAALPYVAPHLSKRKVPVIVGPMRSGKTTALKAIEKYWPRVMHLSAPTTPSLRDTLAAFNAVADDLGENSAFDWTLIIAYHDRNTISRVQPERLILKLYHLHGTLMAATNFYTSRLVSVKDRLVFYNVKDLDLSELSDLDPNELELLTLVPPQPLVGAENFPYEDRTLEERKESRVGIDPYKKVIEELLKLLRKDLTSPQGLRVDVVINDVSYRVYELKATLKLGVSGITHSVTKAGAGKSKSVSVAYNTVQLGEGYVEAVLRDLVTLFGVIIEGYKVYVPVDKGEAIRDYLKSKL